MCANAFTMHSADTCIFRGPYVKKRPLFESYKLLFQENKQAHSQPCAHQYFKLHSVCPSVTDVIATCTQG